MEQKQKYLINTQKKLFKLVAGEFPQYYLTGGTALYMYFNHRFSEDLDFFSPKHTNAAAAKIIKYIAVQTGFTASLEVKRKSSRFVEMAVYMLDIRRGSSLKIDFVKDVHKNLKLIEGGLHSIDDIYYRKLTIATERVREDDTGRVAAMGRQAAKDIFDLYYLSRHYFSLSRFFFKHFSYDKAYTLINWYRGFNRMNLKMELLDIVPKVDTGMVLTHLDNEILKIIPKKLVG